MKYTIIALLGLASAGRDIDIKAAADDRFYMYINGEQVLKGTVWNTAFGTNVPFNYGDQIAVKAWETSPGSPHGLMVELDKKTSKAEDWVCTNSNPESENWKDAGYDDSKWHTPVLMTYKWGSSAYREKLEGSEWFWTSTNFIDFGHLTNWCRFKGQIEGVD